MSLIQIISTAVNTFASFLPCTQIRSTHLFRISDTIINITWCKLNENVKTYDLQYDRFI